jgi:hypothetical protein
MKVVVRLVPFHAPGSEQSGNTNLLGRLRLNTCITEIDATKPLDPVALFRTAASGLTHEQKDSLLFLRLKVNNKVVDLTKPVEDLKEGAGVEVHVLVNDVPVQSEVHQFKMTKNFISMNQFKAQFKKAAPPQ